MEPKRHRHQVLSLRNNIPTVKYSFLDLPIEVRSMVYHYLFSSAQITIQQEPHQPATSPVTHVYRNASFQPSLLRTCKQIGREAFPILAGETTVFLHPGIDKPNDAVNIIPPAWQSQIRTIFNCARVRSRVIHVLRQQHLDPNPFTALRLYRVAHLVYPDWRDFCVGPDQVESFVQSHLETDFFFQAGTLRLFTRARTYSLTVTIWLLKAFVDVSVGWEIDFDLDSWTVLSKKKMRFHRRKDIHHSLLDDPKCRDFRNYDVERLPD